MFHSQIAAPSARSSRHHRGLRPPPERAPAAFMWFPLAERGRLVPRAAPAPFILLAKVTCLKQKPNASPCGRERSGGLRDVPGSGVAARGARHLWGFWGFWGVPKAGSFPSGSPGSPPGQLQTGDTIRAGGRGHFCRAALAGQGSYRWEHGQSRLNSWKPQTSREEGKLHVPSAPHFPHFHQQQKAWLFG